MNVFRYYLSWSSYFTRNEYNIDEITTAIKSAGGRQVRTARQYGWKNQPLVVTFTADYTEVWPIELKLREIGITYPMILQKNWK